MNQLQNMPIAGLVVIAVIAILFVLAVIILFSVYTRYKYLAHKAGGDAETGNRFLLYTADRYAEAYERFGDDINTPAIIADAVNTRLGGLLLGERFLNSAVSLFVTLGLFGTFLGLSLSVSSLTQLLGNSSSTEWLSVLDNVGGGLLSALSGMGVAFYTSLVGVACSILLTILRAIFNPDTQRTIMETRLELWLDHTLAPTLKTQAIKKESELIRAMIDALNSASGTMEVALSNATTALVDSNDNLKNSIKNFDGSVSKFNGGIRGFAEVDYNLRGTVERLDLAVRGLNSVMKELVRKAEAAKLEADKTEGSEK